MNRDVFVYLLVFSFLSIVFLTASIFIWAFGNDYVLYELYTATDGMVERNITSNSTLGYIEDLGDDYRNINFVFDWWFFGGLLIFIGGTVLLSYYSGKETEFGFLGMLFFGIMILLFGVSIINILTDWWVNDILYATIPNLEGTMPMFEYYSSNVGVISFIHALICLFANKIKFDDVKNQIGGNNEVL